jgi:hypothetical protein
MLLGFEGSVVDASGADEGADEHGNKNGNFGLKDAVGEGDDDAAAAAQQALSEIFEDNLTGEDGVEAEAGSGMGSYAYYYKAAEDVPEMIPFSLPLERHANKAYVDEKTLGGGSGRGSGSGSGVASSEDDDEGDMPTTEYYDGGLWSQHGCLVSAGYVWCLTTTECVHRLHCAVPDEDDLLLVPSSVIPLGASSDEQASEGKVDGLPAAEAEEAFSTRAPDIAMSEPSSKTVAVAMLGLAYDDDWMSPPGGTYRQREASGVEGQEEEAAEVAAGVGAMYVEPADGAPMEVVLADSVVQEVDVQGAQMAEAAAAAEEEAKTAAAAARAASEVKAAAAEAEADTGEWENSEWVGSEVASAVVDSSGPGLFTGREGEGSRQRQRRLRGASRARV